MSFTSYGGRSGEQLREREECGCRKGSSVTSSVRRGLRGCSAAGEERCTRRGSGDGGGVNMRQRRGNERMSVRMEGATSGCRVLRGRRPLEECAEALRQTLGRGAAVLFRSEQMKLLGTRSQTEEPDGALFEERGTVGRDEP